MRDRLADVVQSADALGKVDVQPEFSRHRRHQVRCFLGVLKHVLAVAGAEFQASQELHDLRMHAVNTEVQKGVLPFLLYVRFYFFLYLGNDFLDPAGMYTPVFQKPVKRDPRYFPAQPVEPGNNNGFGGVVNDNIHARRHLKSAYVPAFSSYDPSLHLFGGKVHNAYRSIDRVVHRALLYGQADDLAGFFIRLVFCLFLDLFDGERGFIFCLAFHLLHEHLLGLLFAHAGDLLKPLLFFVEQPFQLFFFPACIFLHLARMRRGFMQLFFFLVDHFDFSVEVFFPLQEALFHG